MTVYERIGTAAGRKRGHKSEFTLRLEAEQEAQACVTRCLFCRWRFKGTVAEGRIAALEHRRAEHPERPAQTRIRRYGGKFVVVKR